jgi:hypothetical protein
MVNIHRVVAVDVLAGEELIVPIDSSYIRESPVIATLAERGRAHWHRFHTMELTPESLAEWEAEIPSFGCHCAAKYAEIKAANPPRFEDKLESHRWRWEIHNSVNEHLEKPFFTWAEYEAQILSGH